MISKGIYYDICLIYWNYSTSINIYINMYSNEKLCFCIKFPSWHEHYQDYSKHSGKFDWCITQIIDVAIKYVVSLRIYFELKQSKRSYTAIRFVEHGFQTMRCCAVDLRLRHNELIHNHWDEWLKSVHEPGRGHCTFIKLPDCRSPSQYYDFLSRYGDSQV